MHINIQMHRSMVYGDREHIQSWKLVLICIDEIITITQNNVSMSGCVYLVGRK